MANNEVKIEFKVINAEFQKAMKEMSGEVTKLNKEFRLEQEQLRLNGTAKEKLESRVKYLSERYKLQQQEVKAVSEQLEIAKSTFGENSKEVQNLENKLTDAQRKEAYFANELKQASKELADQNDKFKQLGKSMQEYGKKMQDIGKKMTDVGKNMTLKVTTPIMGIAGAAAKLGIDFERSMSEVQAVTGATGEELKELESIAREVGKTTNKSASEAAQGLKLMGQAGWNVTESQEALGPLVKLSSSANIDLAKATDIAVNGLATMGKTSDDTKRYFDVLAKTSNSVNTDINGLGEAFVAVGGRFNVLGVDIEEGAKSLGVLAEAGKEGSEAGKGLNAILANLTAPTGRAKKALDELNVSAFNSKGEFVGVEETFQLVENAMEGMTTEQKNAYISMIAGKEHTDSFTALLKGLGGTFDTLSEDIANSEGALDDMYETITGDTKGSIEELKSSIEELGLKLYENLQPHIEKLVEWVQKVTDKFNALTPEQQETIVGVGLLVATIGPALLVLGKMATIIGTITSVIGKMTSAYGLLSLAKIKDTAETLSLLALYAKDAIAKGISTTATIAQTAATTAWNVVAGIATTVTTALGTAIAFLTSPIGIAVVAIGSLIAIGVALWKNWDTVKEKAGALWSKIKEVFDKIKNFLKNIFNFKWELPKLKMPKISMEGKFSLVPPSVPKFSIKWNKEGAIFTKPYIFGNQGVGEAGPEAILPISKLAGMIKDIYSKDRDISGMANNTKVINLNGNFEFRNQDDIDYFMEQAELRLLRGGI